MRALNIYEDGGGPNLSTQAWEELRNLKSSHLLPNLQSLEWYSTTETFAYINLFQSPDLTSLNVRVIPNIPNVVPILDSLRVETLEELRFLDSSGDRAVQGAISNLVLRTTATLRSIEVSSDLSDAAIRHVTRLPNLGDASLTFDSLGWLTTIPETSFPSLRSLETRVDGGGGWKRLLQDARNIESIVLHSPTAPHPKEVVDAFGFLISRGFHRTMRRLSFAASEPCDITPPVLTPLFAFGCLTSLSVSPPCDLTQCKSQLTDDTLAQLAGALPRLVELFLGAVPCGSPATGVTLSGLAPLSVHCVYLETLQVHFRVLDIHRDIPDVALLEPSDQASLSPNLCHLTQIVVGQLPISTAERSPLIVASFLHQTFPRLSKIVYDLDDSPWKEVQANIDTIRKFRPRR